MESLNFPLIYFQRHRLSSSLSPISHDLLPGCLLFLHLSLFASNANGQCSFGGVETYEKTSGTTVMCDSGDGGGDGGCTSRGLLAQPESAVTRDCIAICKQSSTCTSFTVGEY